MLNSLVIKPSLKNSKGDKQSTHSRYEYERTSKRIIEKKTTFELQNEKTPVTESRGGDEKNQEKMDFGYCSCVDEMDFDDLTECDLETSDLTWFELILSSQKNL